MSSWRAGSPGCRSVSPGPAHAAWLGRSAPRSIRWWRPPQPVGAVCDWREEPTWYGCAVWARRGQVFGVHASGSHPAVNGLWLQALAMGYQLAIRPSRSEPFTAHRLVHALHTAGFRNEDVVYLPTDYAGADELIRAADLSMVYGGQEVVDKYADDPTVFPNGPG